MMHEARSKLEKILAPHYLFSASSLLGPGWETDIFLLVVCVSESSRGIKCCGYKSGIGVYYFFILSRWIQMDLYQRIS